MKKKIEKEDAIFPTNIFGNKQKIDNLNIMEKIRKENNLKARENLTKEEQIKINLKFIEAICEKDYNSVIKYYNQGAEINYKTESKNPLLKFTFIENGSPIFYAIMNYDERIFDFLVNSEADLNMDNGITTPFLYLIDEMIVYRNILDGDNVEEIFFNKINSLIEKGADVNVKDEKGITPLMKIIGFCEEDKINLKKFNNILEKVINVNEMDFGERTVMHYAFEKKYFEENKKIIELLIAKGANLNVRSKNGSVPLIMAVERKNIEEINLFINNGADLDMQDNEMKTALHHVINNHYDGNLKIVKLLVEKNANVNIQDEEGTTPLMLAIKYFDIEIVKLLRKNGAKVDIREKIKGWDALHYAILSEKIEIVKNLLEVDINSEDDFEGGKRRIDDCGFLYCNKENEEPFGRSYDELLCNEKGYVLKDNNEDTHLMIALQTNNKEIIDLIFSTCYDEKYLHFINLNGENILHKAIKHRNKEMVELLISKKMDVNQKDDMYHTPLMLACDRIYDKESAEIAKLLIEAGADITFVNEKKKSALSIISVNIIERINGNVWDFDQEIFRVYEILNKKIKEIMEYRKTNEPDEEFIRKNNDDDGLDDLPF